MEDGGEAFQAEEPEQREGVDKVQSVHRGERVEAGSAGGDSLRKSACLGKGFVAESDWFLATKAPLAFAVQRPSLSKIATFLRRCQ